MSRIDDLIAELCPNGVVFASLGAVADLANRGVDKVSREGESPVTLVNYMDVYASKELRVDDLDFQTTATLSQIRDCALVAGDLLVTPTSETRQDIGHAAIVVDTFPNVVYSYHLLRVRINDPGLLMPEFLHYLFREKSTQKQIMSAATGITRFGLTLPKWKGISIPIPPLEVQREIVKILDAFTQLEAELEAELEARKKQYAFYRDQLLSFPEGVQWIPMGQLFEVRNGYTPSKSNPDYWRNGSIPWFRIDDIRLNGRRLSQAIQMVSSAAIKGDSVFPAQSILISTSATVGEYAVISVPHLANQRFISLKLTSPYSDLVASEYLEYLGWQIAEYSSKHASTDGNFPSIASSTLKKMLLPLPNLDKQRQIAKTLRSFDALVNDISVGLPAELAARRKQYEYYRDRLLTFNEAVA